MATEGGVPLPENRIRIAIGWSLNLQDSEKITPDASLFIFDRYSNVQEIIYGKSLVGRLLETASPPAITRSKSVTRLTPKEPSSDNTLFEIDQSTLDATVWNLVITLNVFGEGDLSKLECAFIRLLDWETNAEISRFDVPLNRLSGPSVILCVLTRPRHYLDWPGLPANGQHHKELIPDIQQILPDSYPSQLKITVVDGRSLSRKDSNGFSDPYVKVIDAPEVKDKCPPVMKTLNPTWNYTFSINLPRESLIVEIWDWDRFDDDFMGMIELDLQRCYPSTLSKQELTLELEPRPNKPKDVVKGEVKIRIHGIGAVDKSHSRHTGL
eukprot:TRINITY_DN16023_c0_g1_i1.p1 TRINITY_DN16023_c0_g1~~TRINITY_DN16023_c0_g1_i1.p1  ORF type:complete len:325 (+),score=41.68 TRINITY_DN16023_c0_g1_i1:44-1018(+)